MSEDRPSPSATSDLPEGLRREFWLLVGLFNVALLGIGLGSLLLYFRGETTLGWTVLAVGIGAGAFGFGRYRAGTHQRDGSRQD